MKWNEIILDYTAPAQSATLNAQVATQREVARLKTRQESSLSLQGASECSLPCSCLRARGRTTHSGLEFEDLKLKNRGSTFLNCLQRCQLGMGFQIRFIII